MSQSPKETTLTLEERLSRLEKKHQQLTNFCLFLLFFIFLLSFSLYLIGFEVPEEMKTTEFAIGMSITFILTALTGVLLFFAAIAVQND